MSVEALADSILEKLKSISQAETVIGKPIQAGNATIVPVSKVSMGFGLAGNKGKLEISGSGGGIHVEPIAFLVVNEKEVRLLPLGQEQTGLGRIIELVPELIESFRKDKSYSSPIVD
jgi:uncharacterized spore protein YtfJ